MVFREGLQVLDTAADFALVSGLSLLLWATVAAAYVLAIKAFPEPVHSLSAAQVVVMLGFSIAGSALPVPSGSGAWAANTFALTNLFHIPAELAAGTALIVWAITTLAVIPVGLVFARLEGVSLTSAAKGSEAMETAEVEQKQIPAG